MEIPWDLDHYFSSEFQLRFRALFQFRISAQTQSTISVQNFSSDLEHYFSSEFQLRFRALFQFRISVHIQSTISAGMLCTSFANLLPCWLIQACTIIQLRSTLLYFIFDQFSYRRFQLALSTKWIFPCQIVSFQV